ncbi:type VI secretion system baseplate subunit TssG [Saccharospirillum salsuginis]|uniref:Type VI secretion system protein ImpH n=1 Tax=Saccharospirillum salsuginis TaxID=418750 RepID=A0A918N5J9_9GAMM|nr:type VI secretion system baseplate subunit TssG [Saccharospirillum salsuginis]GGX39266.1 hypothetical protein GCM10007392_02010 [Saccharospirillum salsuginis]
METDTRESSHALEAIVAQACDYHFHQLVEVILNQEGAGHTDLRPSWLKLRPCDWLSFPASDVKRVNILEDQNVEVEATFAGFYGVDAPLPQYFLEDVTHQDEVGKRIQTFLDVFNNQTYWLLHQGWRKFRLLQEAGENNLFQRLASAQTGTYFNRLTTAVATPGALASRCRSAAGIENILREALALPELDVDDDVISQVPVDEELTLDGQQALGHDTFLGQQMSVLGQRVDVHTGEVDGSKGQALQPEGDLGQRLGALLQQYLPAGVDYQVQITLPSSERPPLQLGHSASRLGQAMALGEDVKEPCQLTFSKDHYQRALRQGEDAMPEAA